MNEHNDAVKPGAVAVNEPVSKNRRRSLIKVGAAGGALAMMGAPAILRAQTMPKIRIGYWPVAAGLPFFAAVDRGFFKEVGLDVEPLKFAGAQQVMEAMLSGRSDGSSNGTGAANLAIGEIAQPGLFKIFCTNPSNASFVLDQFLVPIASTVRTMAELKGKRVASGPGIQNVTLCKAMLEAAGATGTTVIELPIGQHVASLAAGQVDAAYTLEPTGTIGRLNGTTRVLESGVVAKYILGDPMAPWHGGAASLTSEFIRRNPEATRRYLTAYAKGVSLVRTQPAVARQHMKGYTAIEGALTAEVPLASYMFYNEFKPADVAHFQKFFDFFTDKGVFSKRLMIDGLLYRA